MTNADRIRSMSDEELADITIYYDFDMDIWNCSDGEHCYSFEEALKHELEWLQSEAKESEEE